jgi:DNA-binding CsgD family transcriptional regulator
MWKYTTQLLYFKEKCAQTISKPLIHNEEIYPLLPEDIKKRDQDNINIGYKTNSLVINKYHLGYPFIEPLSIKEFEVLKLYFLGNSTKETAMELYISTRTVEKHLENILSKTACLHFKELRRALFRCPLFYNFFCHDKKQESLGHFKY